MGDFYVLKNTENVKCHYQPEATLKCAAMVYDRKLLNQMNSSVKTRYPKATFMHWHNRVLLPSDYYVLPSDGWGAVVHTLQIISMEIYYDKDIDNELLYQKLYHSPL